MPIQLLPIVRSVAGVSTGAMLAEQTLMIPKAIGLYFMLKLQRLAMSLGEEASNL